MHKTIPKSAMWLVRIHGSWQRSTGGAASRPVLLLKKKNAVKNSGSYNIVLVVSVVCIKNQERCHGLVRLRRHSQSR